MVDGAWSLSVIEPTLSIVRLDASAEIPAAVWRGGFCSVTRSADELSIVCETGCVPAGSQATDGWRALKIEGPLDFSLTGVLSSIARPLAAAGIPIFVISTFDTDYVLMKQDDLARAVDVLRGEGCQVAC